MPLPLYLPGEVPMLGMRSSVDPSALTRGYWVLIDNCRIARLSVTARLGVSKLTSAVIIASAAYRGHWTGYLDGTEYCYLALRVSGTTRTYKIDTSAWTGSEVSSTTTSHRFSTDGNVIFAPVRELGIADGTNEGTDYLYISNGTDTPICTKAASSAVSPLYNFDVSSIQVGTYRPIPKGYFNISDPANTTVTVSDADVTAADTGSAPVNEVSISAGTAVDVSDYANIAFGAGSCVNFSGSAETSADTLDLSKSQQLGLLIYDPSGDYIHNYCNIEVTQGGGQTQIYDATGINRVDPAIVPLSGGYYLAAFRIGSSVASTLTAVSGVRLEYARVLTATKTVRIGGVFALGRVPNGTSYEMAFARTYSRDESSGIILAKMPSAALSEYGCPRTLSDKFPESDSLWYSYRIDWGGTLPDSNVDATYLYRKEPGDGRALFVSDMGVSNAVFNDNLNTLDRADFRPAPSPGGRGPLAALSACYSSDRLYIGGVSSGKSQVWISDQGFPWRFRAFVADEDLDGVPDLDSGLSKSFPGELVQQLVQMPGTFMGLSPVICFTNKRTYRFEGSDAESLSRVTLCNEHGTLYPKTVALHRGLIYYLDSDLIVRRFAGGMEAEPLSLFKVDDKLEAGVMTNAHAIVWKERYYLAYAATTLVQTILIYETQLGEWCRDSYTDAAQNFKGFAVIGSGSTRKMIGFTDEALIYQMEKAAQLTDDGTNITITLTSPELHKDGWSRVFWGRVGVIADKLAATSWTTTRADAQNVSNEGILTGSIDLATNATERAWRWDDNSNYPAGMAAVSCTLTIAGVYQNGKFIKSIQIETEDRENGADADG